MKRESGGNPGQSRCCEFRGGCIDTNATILEERMGRRYTGNKSEDLQNKVEKLSARGKRTMHGFL